MKNVTEEKNTRTIAGNSAAGTAENNTGKTGARSAVKSRKKASRLVTLLIVLAVLIGGTVAANTLTVKKEQEEAAEPEKPVIFSLTPDETAALSVTNDGETLSFTKTDGTWSLDDTPGFPLKQSKVSALLTALKSVEAEKTVEAKDVSSLSEYGLDEPACTVEADGKQLVMGGKSDLDGYLYVSNGDGNVYLTASSLLTTFDVDQDDLIQNETIPEMKDLTSFTVETPDSTYEIDRMENSGIAYSDEYEYFMKDGKNYITLGTDKALAFIENVTQLGWTYCVDWNADDELLESSGLAEPPITVTVAYNETYTKEVDGSDDAETESLTDSDGNTVTETITVPKTFTLYVSGSYARIKDSRMVYYIGDTLADKLTYTSVTELMPEEVLALDFSDVTAADVTYEDTVYSFEKVSETRTNEEGETEIVTVWKLFGQDTDFDETADALTDMLSYGYAGMYPAEGETEITFRLHRTDAGYPETELSFRRYDSTNCIALVDGTPTVLVHRADVSDLISSLGTTVSDAKAAAEEEATAAEEEAAAVETETETASESDENADPAAGSAAETDAN